MKKNDVLALLTLISAASAPGATVFGPGHLDLRVNVDDSGEWSMDLKHDGNGSSLDPSTWTDPVVEPADSSSVLFIPEERSLTRPGAATWDFLGTAAGGEVWIFPSTYSGYVVFPGFSAEETLAADLGLWEPEHASVGSGRWIEIRLLAMDYYGESAQADFSMWTTPGSTPNVWMQTANGIASDGTDDVFLMSPGGHTHMNWGFTGVGVYDLTFQARTSLSSGAESVSTPFTLRFGVGTTAIPEPGILISGSLGLLTLLVRRRSSGAGRLPILPLKPNR
ncbi:MAG: choice-of-anchor M domain-containing protein [Verrucomicrobiales bacterium]